MKPLRKLTQPAGDAGYPFVSPDPELTRWLQEIIRRDQAWETVTLTAYGTTVKYKK